MGEEDVPKGGFRVTDRRHSAEDAKTDTKVDAPKSAQGGPAQGSAADRGPLEDALPSADASRAAERAADAAAAAADDQAPAIDFNTFVLSLSTSAVMHLGLAAPEGTQPQVNLPLAKQTIDLLSLLEEKTRGNLTGEEERLLQQVLFDLRMSFVGASQKR